MQVKKQVMGSQGHPGDAIPQMRPGPGHCLSVSVAVLLCAIYARTIRYRAN